MDTIQAQVGKMTASQKLLLASLSVIAVMTLFLVSQYASKPAMVDLMAVDGQVGTVQALRGGGFNVEMVDGRLLIPQGQQQSALAYLQESGSLPGDTTLLFSNLIQSQDWKASNSQHRQQYNIALQNELARVLANFRGVDRASVILDIPQASGLGRASRAASASVTLFTQSGGPVSQDMVDASAQLVSGAVSGLYAAGVQVTDGSTGRARTTSDDESQLSSRYLEYASKVEKHTKQKIEGLFGHIPGVVVSITAQVDITKVSSAQTMYAPKGEGSVAMETSINTSANSTSQASSAAEPGPRSNQTASINTGGSSGVSSEQETGDKTYQVGMGQTTTNTIDPRGMPTHMSASVIIPEEYIEKIIGRSRPVVEGEEPAPITAQESLDFFETNKAKFESLIRPHLVSVGSDGLPIQGDLTVSMASVGMGLVPGGSIQGAGFMGSLAGGGSGMLGASGKLIETALIGVLAIVSLGMMAMMVKRSSKKVELPSAKELVGVPPHLDTIDDLVGEAGEGEHVMTGIELDDNLVEVQQLREQVAELIKQNPESAASLVERWAEPSM
tara:strand:+ start:35505 stop:37178 length:1674 start_codon:yes stop_codon:yes gene_type:complete